MKHYFCETRKTLFCELQKRDEKCNNKCDNLDCSQELIKIEKDELLEGVIALLNQKNYAVYSKYGEFELSVDLDELPKYMGISFLNVHSFELPLGFEYGILIRYHSGGAGEGAVPRKEINKTQIRKNIYDSDIDKMKMNISEAADLLVSWANNLPYNHSGEFTDNGKPIEYID